MKVTIESKVPIESEAKEIADLVVALQDQQDKADTSHDGESPLSRIKVALDQALRDTQLNQGRENTTR